MFRYVSLPLMLGVLSVAGCGPVIDLFFPPDGETPPGGDLTGSSDLKAFESEEELHDYFLNQVQSRNEQLGGVGDTRGGEAITLDAESGDAQAGGSMDENAASPPVEPDGGAGDGSESTDRDYSDTTIQEEGVDEADVVKTDGTYLYVIDGETLRIVRVWPPEELTLLSEVELEGHGREIYLHDDKIVAITATDSFYYYGEIGVGIAVAEGDGGLSDDDEIVPEPDADDEITPEPDIDDEIMPEPDTDVVPYYQRPQTIVTVIDVSNREGPEVLSQTKFDGWQSSSRMIGGMLHLVIANHQHYYYDVMPMLGQAELDTSSLAVEELLPHFERVAAGGVESSGSAVTWRSMYHPTDPDGFGVVSVISMDVDSDAEFSAVGIVAEPGLIYSSTEALYLTDTDWDFFSNTRETTDIYKFAYVDEKAEPVATGTVPGRILNQYSMGEYQGYLRVATTIGSTFAGNGVFIEENNNVYVLDELDGKLEVVGRVENLAPGEDIRSARFVGDRGYVVTFEQIDPLFTLDLSDPTGPRVVGELKVPGFSTFIVPMDEDHLLTVGEYIPTEGPWWGWGVQLSIFDVSGFNPVQSHNLVISSTGGASSDALYDPKAFTYFPQSGLLALPVWIYGEYGGIRVDEDEPVDGGGVVIDEPAPASDEPDGVVSPFEFDEFYGLMVYQVSTAEGFAEIGRISTQFEQTGSYWSSFTRGVFIEDHVFAVTNNGLRGAPVDELAGPLFELFYGPSGANGDSDATPGRPQTGSEPTDSDGEGGSSDPGGR